MPPIRPDDLAALLDGDDPPFTPPPARSRPRREDAPFRPTMRRNEADPFRCGRCRRMVGPSGGGGRHRNHRPVGLASRHVDLRRPGDRASPCRALMAPVGVAYRADGERLVVHRCNGCSIERRTRVAADDDAAALIRLPPVAQPAEEATDTALIDVSA